VSRRGRCSGQMNAPFDPTVKTLTELSPADWLPLVKRRRRRVSILDSDLGPVVSGATDKIMRVHDKPEYLLHLDFEAGHFQTDLPLRLRLYNSAFAFALFDEVLGMEESVTYQAIVRSGRADEARRLLLMMGETKFGPPDADARATIEGITDVTELEELGVRLMTADSWQELLARPVQRRRDGRRRSRG
jgi:hypothetical protein